ncbi:MAG: AraC family transcriptional regulator [Beijerinckiaceae bacterium]
MDLSTLKHRVATRGTYRSQRLPGLRFFRRENPSNIEASIYEPALCLILQGSKVTTIGDQSVSLSPGDSLVISHTLPVISQITQASEEEPYLSVVLSLNLQLIHDLHDQVMPSLKGGARSLAAGPAEPSWLEPLFRYIALEDTPHDAEVLGPSILREIHYRLLLSSSGLMLSRLLLEDSRASQVAKAIRQLRSDYRKPLRVPYLARTAGMSASSFHEHFKTVTGTTPLQYQKDLRLIEAHALLTTVNHAVADAAFAVGYESPNQFSRDYRRKFGVAPSKVARVGGASDRI